MEITAAGMLLAVGEMVAGVMAAAAGLMEVRAGEGGVTLTVFGSLIAAGAIFTAYVVAF